MSAGRVQEPNSRAYDTLKFCEAFGGGYHTDVVQLVSLKDDLAKILTTHRYEAFWIEHGDFSFASWRMLLEAKPGDTLELKIRQRAFASCPT